MVYNKIQVAFGALRKINGPPLQWQYNEKQILVISGLDLPEFYSVDFMNKGDADTITMPKTDNGIEIPDQFLLTGKPLIAYIVVVDGESVNTIGQITFPVNVRGRRTDISPEPAEQQQIDALVDALNSGVTRAETAAEAAEQAETEIEAYVERAETAASNAETSASNAAESEINALNSARVATTKANQAASSAQSASQDASAANASAGSAAQSAASARESASAAAGSASNAASSANAASGSAGQAASSAQSASGSASQAAGSAQSASRDASAASQSATNAANSATTATTKAGEASESATTAVNAKNDAVTAKEAAETAQAAAEEAAESIEESASAIAKKAPAIYRNAKAGNIVTFDHGAEGTQIRKIVGTIVSGQGGTGYTQANFYNEETPPRFPLLPDAYQEVEYIESFGTEYILTDVIPTASTGFECTFYTKSIFTNSSNFGAVFGSRLGSKANELQITTFEQYASNDGTFRYGNLEYDAGIHKEVKETISLHNLVYTNPAGATRNVSSFTWSGNEKPITLFALNNNGSITQGGRGCRIYEMRFYNGDVLTREYVPCYRKSDNVIGMYETITDTFLVNAGTGAFVKGDNVHSSPVTVNWQTEAGTILNGTVTLNEDGSADIVNSDTEDTYHLTDVGRLFAFDGLNNVWIDTGSIVECEYPIDTGYVVDVLDNTVNNKAPLIVNSASGDVVSFSDGADGMPIKKLVGPIEPLQDLHGYDHPWPAGGGKNKLNTVGTDTAKGYVSNYYLKSNGTMGGNGTYVGFITEYIPLSPSTQYTLSGVTGSSPSICFYDNDKQYLSGMAYNKSSGTTTITFTTDSNTVYCRASVADSVVGTAQLESGSAATVFAPYENICPISGWTGANIYNEETYDASATPKLTINWQDEAGTIYGGTVTLNEDGSADVVPNCLMRDGLSITIRRDISSDYSVARVTYDASIFNIGNSKTNKFKYVNRAVDHAYGTYWYASANVLFFGLGANATDDEIRAEMASTQLLLFYQNPSQTYHFDNIGSLLTYYGQNSIWIDTGSISECDYPADTKLFLTARDEEITQSIAPIENGTTASKAYAQGAYFFHNTKFCKALTAIASGATFTLNTNYTETTVAAELLAAQN